MRGVATGVAGEDDVERLNIEPRPNWTKEVETLGFDFYKQDGVPYWGEDAYYRFTAAEVDIIEAAANKLHKLCLYAVQRIVDMRLFPLLGIDPEIGRLITESWERREPAVYGRFDLIYDGTAPPKLLEYNADTPTSLFEASIVQWNWREQRFPKADQFNSIHESLVARWRSFLVGRRNADRLHVTCATPMPEDETTVQYIGATAQEAGYRVADPGSRLGRGAQTVRRSRRRADPDPVQALSVGMDHARRFWCQRQAVWRALPRADVEDAAVEQRIAADPLGHVPRARKSVAGLSRAGTARQPFRCPQAAARARGSGGRAGGFPGWVNECFEAGKQSRGIER